MKRQRQGREMEIEEVGRDEWRCSNRLIDRGSASFLLIVIDAYLEELFYLGT